MASSLIIIAEGRDAGISGVTPFVLPCRGNERAGLLQLLPVREQRVAVWVAAPPRGTGRSPGQFVLELFPCGRVPAASSPPVVLNAEALGEHLVGAVVH